MRIREVHPNQWQALLKILSFYRASAKFCDLLHHLSLLGSIMKIPPKTSLEAPDGSYRIGKLSVKEEAAGKLRVFAMVDNLTQTALRPLNDFLFDILGIIPNDATMDQRASVTRCFEKAKVAKAS